MMSLFSFGKKNEIAVPKCACNQTASTAETETIERNYCSGPDKKDESGSAVRTEIYDIKVLGSGCKSCHELYENAQAAVKNMKLSIAVEYVTDLKKVVSYGVMSTPALVVNEKVVSMGKVLKASDIEKLLHQLNL